MSGAGGLLRSPAAAVYSFVLVANANLQGYFAVSPTFRDDLGLSDVQTGLLPTASGAVMLLLSLPLGMLADRVGARRLTVLCSGLLALSAVGHAVAVDVWTLLGARLVFGLAFTGMLTAAIAWLTHSVERPNRARAIGGIMPAAGIGGLVGPYLAGALVDLSGTELAFWALAGLATLSFLLVLTSRPGGRAEHEGFALSELRAALRAPTLIAAAALMLLGVLVDVSVSLLVPLQLDDNGLSAGGIGAIASVAGATYVAAALLAVRYAHRLVNLRSAGISGLLIGAVLVPLAASSATAAQATGAIARGIALGLCFTIAFPLGALGAAKVGMGLGAASGLLMIASGAANTIAPVGGASVASAAGGAWVFGFLTVACAAAGTWMIVQARRSVALAAPATAGGGAGSSPPAV